MSDENDDEDLVDVEISGTVRVYKVVQLPRGLAEKMSNAYGFDLKNLVEAEVIFERLDMVEIEDIDECNILAEDNDPDYDEEE